MNGQIEVTVRDNGQGMTESQLREVFNPAFFRVSGGRIAAGNWSLFSCRQIVEEHGGTIQVESTPGSGTAVTVRLPVEG
jgi:two-component system sensor histidine kinase HydH